VHLQNESGLKKALIVHREEPVLTDGLDAKRKVEAVNFNKAGFNA
jgi:hypothetical protein